jgi:biopolymer transport protein ExbD
MGAALGTSQGKSLNVELNIVPFIDLMSCLTAFLLVTAAWTQIASLDTKAKGKARDAPVCNPGDPCEDPQLSVLVQPDEIWIGVSRVNEFERIPNTKDGPDWDRLAERLKAQKVSSLFAEKETIELAVNSSASHPLTYQTMVSAMDIAVKTGFKDVGLTDVNGLSARPEI